MRFLTLKTCLSAQKKSVRKRKISSSCRIPTSTKSNEWIVLFNQRTTNFSGICAKIITNGKGHF